jgi:hypothetical protein
MKIYKLGGLLTFCSIASTNYYNINSSPLYKNHCNIIIAATLLFKSGIYAIVWPTTIPYILYTTLTPNMNMSRYPEITFDTTEFKNHFVLGSKYYEIIKCNFLNKD